METSVNKEKPDRKNCKFYCTCNDLWYAHCGNFMEYEFPKRCRKICKFFIESPQKILKENQQ